MLMKYDLGFYFYGVLFIFKVTQNQCVFGGQKFEWHAIMFFFIFPFSS